ncbi:hypothetical protein HZB97_03970, partial [Candidatus Gottesmanbacteria bacterium]|nr:hypothetical protein [Candidatus Gottesmanbacteria bacterium]
QWLTGPIIKPTLAIACGLILFLLLPYFRAELSYQQSLDALSQNQPQAAYQKNLSAIQFFPYKDSYHLTLSQISLAWANALSQNSPLSTEQKTLVGQLLGQAINQAKLAVTLAPNKASHWENLGIIYKNLIGVAQDADRWSLAAFNSASGLNPASPILQLEIGGVYFTQKDYEKAERFFQNSLFLKKDYSNGFYNLALSQHAQGKLNQAKESLKQTISLTTPGSTDFQNAQKQLSLWNQEQATSSSQLSP